MYIYICIYIYIYIYLLYKSMNILISMLTGDFIFDIIFVKYFFDIIG